MGFKLNKSNLNFSVKTAATMPSNPDAGNDIVAITSTKMNNWIMSPNMPKNAPRNVGDVWVQYGFSGDVINAVKEGSFMIAPLTALQYANDVWKGVPAMVYPNGKKVKFLYNAGNECEALTGGWAGRAQAYDSNFNNIIAPTITKEETGMVVSMSVMAARSGVVEIQNDVDLTNVKSITFDFASIEVTGAQASYAGRLVCTIMTRNAARFQSGATKFEEKIYTSAASEKNTAITIDVSDLSGSYDIAIGIAGKGTSSQYTTVTANCRSVKMEVF